jgi:phage repressor protein C with HTH and peptisase S24 domain
MGWATHAIKSLQAGQTVQIRPRGDSMTGKVNSGDLVTIEPTADRDLQVGDIVLCKVRGNEYLHLIKAIKGNQYQIGNNRGGINGWITARNIFGIATKVEK